MAHEINIAPYLFIEVIEQALPVAHTTDVEVHEVGAPVVSHSSAMQVQGCVSKL